MTTFRAAYLLSTDGQGCTLLTLPEHARLSDDELMAEAIRECREGAGLPCDDEGRVFNRDLPSFDDRDDGDEEACRIVIGDWKE